MRTFPLGVYCFICSTVVNSDFLSFLIDHGGTQNLRSINELGVFKLNEFFRKILNRMLIYSQTVKFCNTPFFI